MSTSPLIANGEAEPHPFFLSCSWSTVRHPGRIKPNTLLLFNVLSLRPSSATPLAHREVPERANSSPEQRGSSSPPQHPRRKVAMAGVSDQNSPPFFSLFLSQVKPHSPITFPIPRSPSSSSMRAHRSGHGTGMTWSYPSHHLPPRGPHHDHRDLLHDAATESHHRQLLRRALGEHAHFSGEAAQ
jgi:hypothetical protein